jgi:hypothetical protein
MFKWPLGLLAFVVGCAVFGAKLAKAFARCSGARVIFAAAAAPPFNFHQRRLTIMTGRATTLWAQEG